MKALVPICRDPSHLSKLSRPIALCLLALGFSALILGRAQACGSPMRVWIRRGSIAGPGGRARAV